MTPKPPLLCRIFGHRWIIKSRDQAINPGYTVTTLNQLRGCTRCGCRNPNFEV